MSADYLNIDKISVRLALSAQEIEDAQRLRYHVFYEEHGATPSDDMKAERRDFDDYDAYTDHLVVVDDSLDDDQSHIVGTYRLLQKEAADRYGQFYSSNEFDLTPFLNSKLKLLELGRSCVLPDYRTRPVMQLLWQGIADYIAEYEIDLMFGCASLYGTDIEALAEQLSYLHHYHPSPADLNPRSLDKHYVDMNIIPKDSLDARRVFAKLPPIIKGYLRLGGTIGDGAYIDEQFNTTDVCVIVQTASLSERYRSHYERKMQKTMPSSKKDAESTDAADTAESIGKPAIGGGSGSISEQPA